MNSCLVDREETLTEMMLFWNQKKIENQADYLAEKYKEVSGNDDVLFSHRSY